MMKKSLLLLAALMLGGCATHWPESALLNPQVIPSNQQYYSGNRITLEGVDKREAAYVFSIKKKRRLRYWSTAASPSTACWRRSSPKGCAARAWK